MSKPPIPRISTQSAELLETRLNIMQSTITAQGKELARLTSHSAYFERVIGYLLKELGHSGTHLGQEVASEVNTSQPSQEG